MTEAPPTAGPEAPPDPLGLRRSRRPKVIAGVCEGAGRCFGIDPILFRVVLAVLAFTGGIGLIVYGFAWLFVRQDSEEQSEAHRLLSGRIEGTALTAVLVTLVGCGLFLSMLGNAANQTFSLVLLSALAGALFWSRQRRRDGEATDAVTADAPPAAQPPPAPIAPSWWREPFTNDPPGGYVWAPDEGPHADALRSIRAPRRRESRLGFVLVPLALLAAATGVLASWWSQPLGTSLEIGLASALAVLGLGLVVNAWAGRARSGTLVAALITGALLTGAAALPKSIGTEWTSTEWSPTAVSQLRPDYELGTGQAELDLTVLGLDGETASSHIAVGAGQLVVRLPDDATVRLAIDVGLGDILLPGDPDHEFDIQPDTRRTLTLRADGDKPSGTIELVLDVGLGQVKVIR